MSDTRTPPKPVGILALQGDYDAHRKMLEERLGVQAASVRTSADLAGTRALVIPGGESTTIIKLMQRIGLDEAIRARAAAGMPIYGTCAGMILLARQIEARPDQPTLGLMDITVARNAFGRQVDSFEADIPFEMETTADVPVRGVFIRAPYVTEIGPDARAISRFRDRVVGVRQGHLLATAFHPELTDDSRIHAYFMKMVETSENEEFHR